MIHIDPKRSSQWMTEFHKQLVRGKQVLLYGNIADLFLLNGEYLSLLQFVERYFREEGYEIIGQYDIVDGLQVTDPKMHKTLESIISKAKGGKVNTGESSPNNFHSQPVSPEAGQLSIGRNAPPRKIPKVGAETHSVLPTLQQPDQAMDAIRTLLSQGQVSGAMVVNFSDKLVSDPERQTEQELKLMVQIKKIVQDAAYLQSGQLIGRKNTIVIVATQLRPIPPWLYQDNPFLSLLQVTRPRMEERKNFIRSFVSNFHMGQNLSQSEVEESSKNFSEFTDGLTTWDLEAIRRTSLVERIAVTRTKALVDYYKYGQREDPWEKLDMEKIRRARQEIEKRVVGQPIAVEAIINMLLAARVGISMSEVTAKAGKPKGTFFFVGPTGVGKTEMAKALTALVFGDDTAFARFDMSEYAEQHAAEKLTGSPPGYVGYDEGGQLTNWVRERPFTLLLFDEIEKAHGRVMDKFLQILEDGRLTDGKGQTAYFSQSVIIFTSNIGSDTLSLTSQDNTDALQPYESVRNHYLAAVREHFTKHLKRPELLNRLGDNVIVFDMLRPEHITGICQKFLASLVNSALEKNGFKLVFQDNQVVEMIAGKMKEGDNMLFGGRRIKTLLEACVERPLNRWIFFNSPAAWSTLAITSDTEKTRILVNGGAAE